MLAGNEAHRLVQDAPQRRRSLYQLGVERGRHRDELVEPIFLFLQVRPREPERRKLRDASGTVAMRNPPHLEYGTHPPKPPEEERELLELDEEPDLEEPKTDFFELPDDEPLKPLDLLPIPPGWEEEERRVTVPLLSTDFGRTEEPTKGLLWKLSAVYFFAL